MRSSVSFVSSLLAVVAFVKAQTPPDIYPQVANSMIAGFGSQTINAGDNLSPDAVAGLPQIGLASNTSSTGNRYMLMIVDLDYNGSKRKRQNFQLDSDTQPQDSAHAGGQGTYLHALIQDYSITSSAFGTNGKLLQSSGNPPAGYQAPALGANNNHRYMMMLFDQPLGFKVPSSVQQLVNLRSNFDIRNFISQSNLAIPRYGTWFICNGGSGSTNASGSAGSAGSSNSGGSAATTTVAGSAPSSQPAASASASTIYSASTLPSGGPTLTFQYTTLVGGTPASTASGSASTGGSGSNEGGSGTTLTYMTTQTLPNGGPTATFLTTSVATGPSGQVCVFNNANICRSDITTYYTTGFIGFTVLSSFSVEAYTTTTTASNGQVTAYRTSSTHTYTRAFTGVSHISLSTYVASSGFTTTVTGYLNSQLTTYTSTGVSVATTTSAAPLQANAAATMGAQVYFAQAALAVAGAALAVL